MKHGLVMRRLATAVLVSFAGLLLMAAAQILFGVEIDDAVRRGARMLAFETETFEITHPIRLSATPDLLITSGRIVFARTVNGSQRAIELQSPVVEITVAGLPPQVEPAPLDAASAEGGALLRALAPLANTPALADLEQIKLRQGTLLFKWGDGVHTLSIDKVDAEISKKRRGAGYTAAGQFDYLGQRVTFDAGSLAAVERANAGYREPVAAWPVRLELKATALEAHIAGALEVGNGWQLDAETVITATDANALATWLGHGWRPLDANGAIMIKGPARWRNGVIAFGKSAISLGDQSGVGAIALGYRGARPIIEASAAFAALDVARWLTTRQGRGAGDAAVPLWRSLPTTYPATRSLDIDLRLSVGTLQWQGTPVGRGAFGVSARHGIVHGDFAELDLGGYSGNLQVAIDETTANAPVTVRGRFVATDLSRLTEEMFGAGLLSGKGASQFELSGRGDTLGQVVDSGSGRGSLDARDGTINLDLAAMQRLAAQPSGRDKPSGWSSISAPWTYQSLGMKFQLHEGTLIVDQAELNSNGLAASAVGRVGITSKSLDLAFRFGPWAGAEPGGRGAMNKTGFATAPARAGSFGDVLTVHGPWTSPSLSVTNLNALP